MYFLVRRMCFRFGDFSLCGDVFRVFLKCFYLFFNDFLFFLFSYILIWLVMVWVFNRRACFFNIFAVYFPTFISTA